MDDNSNPGVFEDEEINEDDIAEVIEIEDGEAENLDDLTEEVGDVDFEHYDGDDGEDEAMAEMEELPDDAEVCFKGHSASLFSCDVDPTTSTLAVTGGEDDRAFVWTLANGQNLFECTGHKDSVTCVCFNHDSSMVATGDMSGLIKVWKVETKTEIWSFECADLEWLSWHHAANVLLAGTADGDIWMWKIPSGEFKTMQGPRCQTTTGKVFPDGKRCCAGYEDGSIRIWDLKETSVLQTFTAHTGHSGGITSLDCHSDGSLLVSGSTDSTAKLLNSNTGKVIATFAAGPAASEDESNSVEAVAFCKSQPLVAVGSLNGIVGLWDIPTQIQRNQCKHEAGIVRVVWDATNPLVYTCCLDGVVRLWDGRSGQVVSKWTGHMGEILDMAITRDGNSIVTASGDKTARVFAVHKPDR
ncbi:angio-associated migratory cell protein-like [Ptychodera flava]|uniref:angio-associated migratory cell protein-like n=1 Tax=Ptychodera flava TaxID=63121 RepID=UPI00396AAD7E